MYLIMRQFVMFVAVFLFIEFGACKVVKRTAFHLSDGLHILKSPLVKGFTCTENGYYADMENNCQIYHVCLSKGRGNYPSGFRQWTFLCGPGTYFNQLTLTCIRPESSKLAVPCERADYYYDVNYGVFDGDEKTEFLSHLPFNKEVGKRDPPPRRVGHLDYRMRDETSTVKMPATRSK